jgi:hypothetical protein
MNRPNGHGSGCEKRLFEWNNINTEIKAIKTMIEGWMLTAAVNSIQSPPQTHIPTASIIVENCRGDICCGLTPTHRSASKILQQLTSCSGGVPVANVVAIVQREGAVSRL